MLLYVLPTFGPSNFMTAITTIATSETGIGEAISSRIKSVENGKDLLTVSHTFQSPEEIQKALNAAKDMPLRDLAAQAAEAVCKEANALVGLAVICRPDVDENADNEQGSAVAVYMESNLRSRAYGFGGKSELAKAWVSSWAMSNAWRMLKEKFEVAAH